MTGVQTCALPIFPEVLYDIVRAAYHHKGLSFVRIVQRCPEWLPKMLDPWLHDPQRVLMLHHGAGLQLSSGLSRVYKNLREHDPRDLNEAREIASSTDPIPVGILYSNPDIPCYEDIRRPDVLRTPDLIRAGLNAEFDKFTVWPQGAQERAA